MCQPKPGRRCDTNVQERIANVGRRFDRTRSNTEKAAAVLDAEHALWDSAASKNGQEQLSRAIDDEPNERRAKELTDRLAAGVALGRARDEQLKLMPPRNGTRPGEAEARREVAVLREQLAYAAADKAAHRNNPSLFVQAKRREFEARVAVVQLSAEWGWRADDSDGGGPPTHCSTCGRFGGEFHDCTGPTLDRSQAEELARQDSTPDEWNELVADGSKGAQRRLRAAARYMLSYGHMQCPVCGRWRSVRVDNHDCPGERVQAEVKQATLDPRVAEQARQGASSVVVPDPAPVALTVRAPNGRAWMGDVRMVDVVDADGGTRHQWELVRPDGVVEPVESEDAGRDRALAWHKETRTWQQTVVAKVGVERTTDGREVRTYGIAGADGAAARGDVGDGFDPQTKAMEVLMPYSGDRDRAFAEAAEPVVSTRTLPNGNTVTETTTTYTVFRPLEDAQER